VLYFAGIAARIICSQSASRSLSKQAHELDQAQTCLLIYFCMQSIHCRYTVYAVVFWITQLVGCLKQLLSGPSSRSST
jgi:hypothetical protein